MTSKLDEIRLRGKKSKPVLIFVEKNNTWRLFFIKFSIEFKATLKHENKKINYKFPSFSKNFSQNSFDDKKYIIVRRDRL